MTDLGPQGLGGDNGEANARFYCETREGEGDTREDVDDDLLVDGGDAACSLGALTEDEIATNKAAEKAVVGT